MKLRPEFEAIRENWMKRALLPSLDACLHELLQEEQKISPQATKEARTRHNTDTQTQHFSKK